MTDFAYSAAQACCRLLRVAHAWADPLPVAPYRRRQQCSVRVNLDQGTVIATVRSRPRLARREAAVLRVLNGARAPAPRILAFDGTWLIQEDLGRCRLSQVVARASEEDGEAALDAALRAIVECQAAAHTAGLERLVPYSHGHRVLLRAPAVLGKALGLAPPVQPEWELIFALQKPYQRFIKWDARLGNAIMGDDGAVGWIDWEECGQGDSLRDLVKVLCDDWLPDWPAAEERLIESHLPSLLHGRDPDQGRTFLAVYGTLLSVVRLNWVVHLKGDGPWWDPALCLEHELVTVTPEAAERHCRRGARWARRSALTEGLAPWLEALAEKVASLIP